MANLVPIVVVSVLTVLAVPIWPWSRGWGWAPAGMLVLGVGTIVVFSWTVAPD